MSAPGRSRAASRVKRAAAIIAAGVWLGAGPAAAAPPDTASKQEARELYNEGLKYYNLTDYDRAIQAFKTAYELTSEPALLYNIAQAYRLQGDCPQAARFYRNFLREAAGHPQRADAERSLKRCEAEASAPTGTAAGTAAGTGAGNAGATGAGAAAGTGAAVGAAAGTGAAAGAGTAAGTGTAVGAAAGTATATGAAAPGERGRAKRVAGAATAGVGLALLAGGAFFGVRTLSRAGDVESFAREGGTWDPSRQDLQSSGESAARWSNVLLVAGAVATVGGGALYLWGRREASRGDGSGQATVAFDGRSSLVLGWMGSF